MMMIDILLVDDEQSVLDGLKLLIPWEELGIDSIRYCKNGEEALVLIEESTPHILITDIRMPKMNGIELLYTIRQKGYPIKCIILSGYNDFEYVKKGIKYDVENYILKPVDRTELLQTINQIIHKIELEEEQSYLISKKHDLAIRNNILNRMIRNQINVSTFNERIKVLNIDLINSSLQVAVIYVNYEVSTTPDINILDKVICQLLSKLLPQEHYVLFPNMEGQLVIIFLVDYIDNLHDILNITTQKSHLPIHIATGTVIEHYKNLHESYKYAKKAADYFMINKNVKVIHYNDIKMQHVNKTNFIKLNHRIIEDKIQSGNKEDLLQYIQDIYNQQELKQSSPDQVRIFTMELFLIYHRIINSLNGSIYHIDSFPNSIIDYIHQAKSIDDLKKWTFDLINYGNTYIENLTKKQYSKTIQCVINYINSHYNEEISLKTLSAKMSFSPSYLGKKFRKEVGCLFGEYVNSIKMEKAKQLLLETNLKASKISEMLGIHNTNYFYALFKKYYNITPTEYRNRH
ncbi:response regulator [Vallitalea sp.]|jgi:two-component system response regulator YesN|uniref:response regulator n=1 Tax=Vallitalea sp. TaxID=1882829 RepID=UPI0025DE0EA8|nr:response regulator [Vallitalea sp.]MCT4685905.1 response regulator [Vallitalea sp.]